MSTLILPAWSLLKPDRAWDIPRPGCRPRSRWWRHLLGARNGLTRLQPGSCCGCGPGTVPCSPCAIPATNLTVEWDFPAGTGAVFVGTGSGTLVYTAGASTPWNMSCAVNGTGDCFGNIVNASVIANFKCDAWGFASYYNTTCAVDPTCGYNPYNYPADTGWTIASYTCSPYSFTYQNTYPYGTATLTIHA